MLDLPLGPPLNVIGGVRFESTEIGIVNTAEPFAQWYPPGATGGQLIPPGAADVDFSQDDVLPAVGLVYVPVEALTLRASYSQTVARQTFKELTPIVQQEYLGGPAFIGNPELGMSSLQNYDLRLDYTPYAGGLVSASVFHKDIEDPIEYVQRLAGFTFTTADNYPVGRLSGLELELRQQLETWWGALEGFALGANATFIESEVTLPDDDAAVFDQLQVPMHTRDMTNAPEHLYNLYLTYDFARTRTQAAVFYTVTGDTLVAGAGQSFGNFVPDVYATEYGTLNASVTQSLGEHFKLQLQAKNLTNPEIEEVYRSKYIDGDVRKSSHTEGIELSLSIGAHFSF
jgi:TonB-dependent receptor